MDYNFNQLFNAYNFTPVLRGDFVLIGQFHFLYFAFFKPKVSSYCTCICLNSNTPISVGELHSICSLIEQDEKEFEEIPELDFDSYITNESVYSYALNLISFAKATSIPNIDDEEIAYFREFHSFISSYKSVFGANNFFFYHFKNSFALRMKSLVKGFDIVDFSLFNHSLRFNTPECYFESPTFNPCNTVFFAFNPMLFYSKLASIDHPENQPFNHKFIVPGTLSETSLTKIYSSLPDNASTPYTFLCSSSQDSFNFLKFLCTYATFFRGKTFRVQQNGDFFSLDIFLGLNESASKTIQLFANIQNAHSNADYSPFMAENYPFKTVNSTTPFFKIISCTYPMSFISIKSCYDAVCSHFMINFNLNYL